MCGDFRQRIELFNESLLIGLGVRINREHSGRITDAQHLATGELPVYIAGKRGEIAHGTDMRLIVEHRLIQVRD